MKFIEKILIFIACLFAEFLSAYIFMKYARFSASDLWQLCFLVMLVSMTIQGVLPRL